MKVNSEGLILVAMLIGGVMGFFIAICVIDDMPHFRIPLTDKVFVRDVPTEGN